MMSLKRLRRWSTAHLTTLALRSARCLSPTLLTWLEGGLAQAGRFAPLIAAQARRNMRAAGCYSGAAHRAHFRELARHLTQALAIWKCPTGPDAAAAVVDDALRRDVALDASAELLRRHAERGGFILLGPHIANFLTITPAVSRIAPLTVYLRYSKDPRRRAAKQRWAEAVGVRFIAEPASETDPTSRFRRMVAAVRAGAMLYVTPDLPQKRNQGRPTTLLGRTVFLPGGVALLAARTGAPVVWMAARRSPLRGAHAVTQISFEDWGAAPAAGARDWAEALHARYAAALASFILEQTPLWFFWCDKRWTRVFAGDEAYTQARRDG